MKEAEGGIKKLFLRRWSSPSLKGTVLCRNHSWGSEGPAALTTAKCILHLLLQSPVGAVPCFSPFPQAKKCPCCSCLYFSSWSGCSCAGPAALLTHLSPSIPSGRMRRPYKILLPTLPLLPPGCVCLLFPPAGLWRCQAPAGVPPSCRELCLGTARPQHVELLPPSACGCPETGSGSLIT